MFEINESYSGINVTAKLRSRICFFYGQSGLGKTFFFRIVKSVCSLRGLVCTVMDYNNIEKSEEDIISFCKNSDIVILDNADLYLTNHMLRSLNASTILVSVKTIAEWDKEDAGLYTISYNESNLSVRERGLYGSDDI